MATPTLKAVAPTTPEADLAFAPEPVVVYGLPEVLALTGQEVFDLLKTLPGYDEDAQQILSSNMGAAQWVDAPTP